jgi:hypothetical protein
LHFVNAFLAPLLQQKPLEALESILHLAAAQEQKLI